LAPPKQATLVCALTLVANGPAGWVMVALRVVVHPFTSTIVHVQVPAGRFVAVAVFCTGALFHENV
jgi:hypothetical protein